MDMLHIDSNMTASIVLNKRNMFIKTEASLPVPWQKRWGTSRIIFKAFGHKICIGSALQQNVFVIL
jgi:hypothetical protein